MFRTQPRQRSQTTTGQLPPQQAQPTLVLRLAASPRVQEFLDRFVDIFTRHEGDNELSRLGEEICVICLNGSLESEDVLHQLAQKVHEIGRVLSNPFDGSPLRQPVVEGGRLWEAWMLAHVREVCDGISPIDERPLEEGVPYAFGAEFLQWEEDLLAPSTDPYVTRLADRIRALHATVDSAGWLQREAILAADPQTAQGGYRDLAHHIVQRELIERRDAIVKRATDQFALTNQAIQSRTRQQVAATVESLRTNEEALARELTFIRETNASIVSDYERQLKNRNDDIRRLESRAHASETRAQRLENQLSAVQSQLRQLAHENEQNRQAAANGGGGDGCSVM